MLGSRIVAHFRNNVYGLVAVFIALSGTAYAVDTVGSSDIIDNSVASSDLRNNDIRSADVRDEQLTTEDVADGALTAADISTNRGGSLTQQHLGVWSVGSSEVAPDAVNGVNVLDGSLDGADVEDGGIGSAEVLDQSLFGQDIGDSAIGDDELQAGSVGTSEAQDNSLTGTDINESSLAPTLRARVANAGKVDLPPSGQVVPITSEVLPVGQWLVLARVVIWNGNSAADEDAARCSLRAGSDTIDSVGTGFMDAIDTDSGREYLTLMGWTKVNATTDLVLECADELPSQGTHLDVVLTRMAALPLHSWE